MIFDTDVFIWIQRGSERAARVLERHPDRFIAVQTYMELMQGARNKQEQIMLKQFLNELDFTVLPITEAISHRAMIFVEEYALQSGIQLADALVFATACEHSLTLCSANQKHFRSIRSLDSKVFKPE